MRVLHIGAGNLYGGVETLLVTLARYRDLCAGMEPEFALCFEGRLSAELKAASVPLHMLGRVRTSRLYTVLRARHRLAGLLRRSSFDVVLCHMAWPQAIFGPTVRRAGLPLVVWRHDAGDGRHWLERWARRTEPDLTICNSRFAETALASFCPGIWTEVIYCPVALPEPVSQREAMKTRSELGVSAKTTVIIQVSRLETWKGHQLHLEALGKLRKLPGWVCWMVGGAQRPHEVRYLDNLKQKAARLDIADRVLFLGQRSDVPQLLAAADVHCQPNTGPEPFGITFIEAMYAHLPIVTTALGGAQEIIDGSCGMLVP
ncbi:MAG: glycosyltransferase, partial [Acidobacteriota bacterium]